MKNKTDYLHTYQIAPDFNIATVSNSVGTLVAWIEVRSQRIYRCQTFDKYSVDRLLSVCSHMFDRHIGQRIFLCTICALEH